MVDSDADRVPRSKRWLSTSSSTGSLNTLPSAKSLTSLATVPASSQPQSPSPSAARLSLARSSDPLAEDDVDIDIEEGQVDLTSLAADAGQGQGREEGEEQREGQSPEGVYADAAYHAANIAGMVNFAPVVESLPAGTVVVEVSQGHASVHWCIIPSVHSYSCLRTLLLL
jgi:hypothetical protein